MMKLYKFLFSSLLLLTTLLLVGCRDQGQTVELIDDIRVKVTLPEGYEDQNLEGLSITMRGSRTSYTAQVNQDTIAVFSGVLPDSYTLSTSKNLSPFLLLSGQVLNQKIYAESTSLIELELNEVKKSSLVVSKIYGSGVKDDANKNYTADVYIEFYNNSEETVLLDSTIYFGLIEAESTPAFPAIEDKYHVYTRQVFRFISDGATREVLPGEAILVSNSAVNHKLSASKSVDLSVSDFEAKDPSGKVQNNPAIPAIEKIYSVFATISNMNIVRAGENGIILFATSDDVKAYPTFQIPGKPTSKNYYMRIPASAVLDGVEVLKSTVTPDEIMMKKRLSVKIDQGFAKISNTSGYNGEVIVRKLKYDDSMSFIGLIDANNSNDDCFVSATVQPKKFDY
ncbi:MAG: DUF4876 domain-containing protein [Bacteroidales bacterium]